VDARLRDGGEEGARGLVAQRLVPLRRAAAVLGLEEVDELLRLRVLLREQRAPPHRAQDVLDVLLAQRLRRLLLGAARAIALHLVAKAGGHVLPLHGDVVGQVRVREEEVGLGGLHLAEQRGEVLAGELERLVHHHLVVLGLVGPLGDALAEVLPVRGVLPEQRDGGGLGQLAGLLLRVDPLHDRLRQQLHRRQQPEHPLVAALVDGGGGAAAVHVGDGVLLRHHALRLHQIGGIGAEQELHLVAVDQAIGQGSGGGLGAGVVQQRQPDLHLLPADVDAALLVGLLECQLVSLLVEAAGPRLGARQRQGGADQDLVARGCCRLRGSSASLRSAGAVGGGLLLARGDGQRAEKKDGSVVGHGALPKPLLCGMFKPSWLTHGIDSGGLRQAGTGGSPTAAFENFCDLVLEKRSLRRLSSSPLQQWQTLPVCGPCLRR